MNFFISNNYREENVIVYILLNVMCFLQTNSISKETRIITRICKTRRKRRLVSVICSGLYLIASFGKFYFRFKPSEPVLIAIGVYLCRIVLERPEYGFATYFFELIPAMPIDWQIKRLVTAMKINSRASLLENKPLLV